MFDNGCSPYYTYRNISIYENIDFGYNGDIEDKIVDKTIEISNYYF